MKVQKVGDSLREPSSPKSHFVSQVWEWSRSVSPRMRLSRHAGFPFQEMFCAATGLSRAREGFSRLVPHWVFLHVMSCWSLVGAAFSYCGGSSGETVRELLLKTLRSAGLALAGLRLGVEWLAHMLKTYRFPLGVYISRLPTSSFSQ